MDILNPFSTDHSPVFCSFTKYLSFAKGRGFWKLNNSLICNIDFADEMKTFIHNIKIFSDQNDTLSNQSNWEFLKYEIRKRSISFSKALVKKSKNEHALSLPKITKLEQDIDSEEKFDEYEKTMNELEKIYDNIAEGVKVRSKCSWYQHGEKSTKFFYGLEKENALRRTIETLLEDGKEITSPSEISLTQKKIYEKLFQKNIAKSLSDIEMFLSDIHLPTISDENYNICEAEITEDNPLVSLKNIPNNKTPGNDGLFKEFYETFWEDIKDVFIKSSKLVKIEGSLSISQRQAVVKLLEKKHRDKIHKKLEAFFFTQY